MTTPEGSPRDLNALRAVRVLGVPIVALLAIEFLLGMALNLFVGPATGSAATILASNPVLIVHILVAVMLIGITGRAVTLSARLGDGPLLAGASLGLAGAVVATLAGSSFTFGSSQSTVVSYVMSLGFAVVLIGAVILLRPVSSSTNPTQGTAQREEEAAGGLL